MDKKIVEARWWKTGVVYQIYPRSFADTNGDGIGDLEGIRRRLDHIEWLGVDAIWLSPIYPSPMADFGYDVADYCDVDPVFGTLGDLDHLIDEAHRRNIRVLLDWVPNHTSDRHPWFVESRASRTSPKRNWYYWRDPAPRGGPPNNWTAAFGVGVPAWTYDSNTGQYYLHSFLPQQPDLNWSNPEVVEAMHGVLRFWLDRGIDGFRVDVVHGIGKDPALPDDPPQWTGVPHTVSHYHPSTHEILRGLRRLIDSYPGQRALVGEVWVLLERQTVLYYGRGDELHLAFDLPEVVRTPWEAGAWRSYVERLWTEFQPVGAWPTWVLSNHDIPRHATRFGSEAQARCAAVLLLTLPGTPFLYSGEELGLENADVPKERQVDPGGRDGCRAPIPWTPAARHGWEGREPWLPWPPDPQRRNVQSLRADPGSILHLYRRMLAARRASPALRLGSWKALAAPGPVLAYERVHGEDRRVVLINFSSDEVSCAASGVVEVASDGVGEGTSFRGSLAPDQAVVLRPK
jgi:alpha-glucosidase